MQELLQDRQQHEHSLRPTLEGVLLIMDLVHQQIHTDLVNRAIGAKGPPIFHRRTRSMGLLLPYQKQTGYHRFSGILQLRAASLEYDLSEFPPPKLLQSSVVVS